MNYRRWGGRYVIRKRTKNQLLMIGLVVGFLIGIVYENVAGTIFIFQTEYLKLFQEMSLDRKEYLFYILKVRVYPLIGIPFLWNFKWRKIITIFLVGWFGFFSGRLLVSAILLQGIKGICLYIAVAFPHMVFYLFAYLILVFHLFSDRKQRWNKLKTIVLVLLFSLGIGCEVYINPQIVKRIIGWI